jgi:diguanylate cyclase (GGDEF)-like protein
MSRSLKNPPKFPAPGTPPEAVVGRSGEEAALAKRVAELEQRHRAHLELHRLGSYLRSCVSRLEAYQAIECFGPQLFPNTDGMLYLVRPSDRYVERIVAWGNVSETKWTFGLQDCWALRRARPHWVHNPQSDLICAHATPALVSSLPCVCVPLIAQGELLGMLRLEHFDSADAKADSYCSTAEIFAEEAGLALSNLKLREGLHEQSVRDPLTNLYNRRFLEEYLARELARAGRKVQPLSMILIDIDHFKNINDTYGHGAGDVVLRRVGMTLQQHVRESDIACRVGGEEFSLLLPEASLQTAVQRAEDIRGAVRRMALKYENEDLGAITASFGVAAFPDHGNTLEALIRYADMALYEAKRSGRDRVMSATTAAA